MVGVARRMKVSPACKRGQAQLLVFFRRQIDHDHAVRARCLGVGQKFLHAIDIDRIVIAHQDDRRVGVLAAEIRDELEHAFQLHPGVQRAQARRLDRGAVGHGVAEGHADFDDVGASLGQRLEDLQRNRRVGIAAHDESDERGAVFRAAIGETFFKASGHGRGGSTMRRP